jgi:hypothetical protein
MCAQKVIQATGPEDSEAETQDISTFKILVQLLLIDSRISRMLAPHAFGPIFVTKQRGRLGLVANRKALRQVTGIAASQRVRVFNLSDVNEITLASIVKLYFSAQSQNLSQTSSDQSFLI